MGFGDFEGRGLLLGLTTLACLGFLAGLASFLAFAGFKVLGDGVGDFSSSPEGETTYQIWLIPWPFVDPGAVS